MGPFAKLLLTIAKIQAKFPTDKSPIRTALVTARSAPISLIECFFANPKISFKVVWI